MSNVITNLCRPLQMKSTPKCVLMALADRADDDGMGWPSIAWICEWTCFSRSTVIEALNWLDSTGLIVLNRLQGKQHRCFINVGAVALWAANPSASRMGTDPGAGPVEPARSDIDPSASRTGPPAVPVREPDTPPSASRMGTDPGAGPPRPGAGPDTPEDTNKTSIKTKRARVPSFDPMSIELPDWMPAETWGMWARYRVETKKPITEDGARLQLGKLAKFREEGHDPVLVVEAAVENRWQGLYLPKDGSTQVQGTRGLVL